jgi:hypothetical protein
MKQPWFESKDLARATPATVARLAQLRKVVTVKAPRRAASTKKGGRGGR